MITIHPYVDYFVVFNLTEYCSRVDKVALHVWRYRIVKISPSIIIAVLKVS